MFWLILTWDIFSSKRPWCWLNKESLISLSLRSLASSGEVEGTRRCYSGSSLLKKPLVYETFESFRIVYKTERNLGRLQKQDKQSTQYCHWYGEKDSWKMQLKFTLGALWVKLKSWGPFSLLEDLQRSSWSSQSWRCRQSRRPISKDGDFSWRGQSCRQRGLLLVGWPSVRAFWLVGDNRSDLQEPLRNRFW